jgi:hypothetical protein
MRNLFQSADRQGPWHPREDDLLLYIDGELPARRHARIGAHLKACWACRAKVEKVESTISAFMDYRSRVSARLGGITSDGAFRLRLCTLARQQGSKQSIRKSVARAWRLAVGANFRVPVMAAAGVLAVALLVLGWKYFAPPPVSAGELLADASLAESARANDGSVVLHRSLLMEKRRSGEAKPMERRRIDVWHAGKSGVTVRRLYDESGHLLAAEWRRRDGSAEIYSPQTRPRLEPRTESPPAMLNRPEDLWRLDPSAASFVQLAGDASGAKVSRQGEDFRVSLGPDHAAGHFLKAVLTIRRNSLHATGIDLRLAGAADLASASEPSKPVVYDYSIAEDTYEQESPENTLAQVFEPDAMLAPPAEGQASAATPDLQIETTYLLDQVGATLGQEVTVAIGADHKLHIEGVLATESRKAQIIKALAPVRHNPAEVINLITVAEALQRTRAEPAVVAKTEAKAERASIPLNDQLSQYFEAQTAPGSSVDVRAKIQRLSEQVLEDTGEAMRHAWVLKRLANAIPPTEIGSLSETTHNKYLCMVAAHAQKVGERTEKLRLEIGPILFPDSISPGMAGEGSGASPTDLTVAVRQLFEAALQNDAAIQSGFSVTTGQAVEGTAKAQEIQYTLLQAERLSKWLGHATNVSDCGPESPRK